MSTTPLDEKSTSPTALNTNILTITRPTPSRQPSSQSILSTIEDVSISSMHTLSPTATHTAADEKMSTPASASSPFYNPSPTGYSLEASKSSSKQHIAISSYETDVEACLTPQQTTIGNLSKNRTGVSTNTLSKECTVWPGQKQMKRKKKAMKFERGRQGVCGCMAGLDRKTKIWVKVLMALLVIGLAVGVGVGISKAVGGGIWKSDKSTNTALPM
ncbi:hypothetical protein CJF30_00003733 [Rutstroemia sp. NJR-2017a BBW]|nr:hypothetical protein CJF30_00003733 [Rutstroemia sp. NJR-2017a BBW]